MLCIKSLATLASMNELTIYPYRALQERSPASFCARANLGQRPASHPQQDACKIDLFVCPSVTHGRLRNSNKHMIKVIKSKQVEFKRVKQASKASIAL